jgi:membrane associated rhomboid family serine protease
MASIFKDISSTFKKGSFLTRLIYVNVAFFLVVKILSVFSYLTATGSVDYVQWFGIAASYQNLLSKPWTVLTHMFFHLDFVHLLFNLMMLYYSGRIFMSYLSNKQLVSTYILGGLYGAIFYIACYNLLPVFEANIAGSIAFGASASVLAITTSN